MHSPHAFLLGTAFVTASPGGPGGSSASGTPDARGNRWTPGPPGASACGAFRERAPFRELYTHLFPVYISES